MEPRQNFGINNPEGENRADGEVSADRNADKRIPGIEGSMNQSTVRQDLDIPEPGGPRLVVAPAEQQEEQPLPVWMQRTFLVIWVVFCVEIGLLLAILPWTPVWTGNGLVAGHPVLKAITQQNFVRGMVTGVGLLDIWLGIWEAVHYRDRKPAAPTP